MLMMKRESANEAPPAPPPPPVVPLFLFVYLHVTTVFVNGAGLWVCCLCGDSTPREKNLQVWPGFFVQSFRVMCLRSLGLPRKRRRRMSDDFPEKKRRISSSCARLGVWNGSEGKDKTSER